MGTFKDGRQVGYLEVYPANGDLEMPVFAGLLESGDGRMETEGGSMYEGGLSEGGRTFQGWGEYEDACGNRYDGEWVGGKRHGRGNFTWVTGQR